MKKKQIPKILLSVLLALWLFFPRFSSRWNIVEDEALLEGKRRYLEQLTASSRNHPNVLIILADDLGRNDLALYDPVNGIETPNITALAASGTTFADATASSPICAPSRAGLLTGRIQNRSGFDSQPMQIYPYFPAYYYGAELFLDTDEMSQIPFGEYPYPWELKKQGVPHSEIFLQEILSQADYSTALIGKWHLGYGESQHPNVRGFDHFYGFLEAFSYYDDPDKEDVVSSQHDLFWEEHIWKMKRRGPSAIQINGKKIEEERHLTDAIAEETINRIRVHRENNGGEPFFIYSSFSAPHTPFQELQEYYDRFEHISDPNRRVYAAMISHLDDAVGSIVAELEAQGIRDETLIIFGSDNGGAAYTEATENGELAGGKFSQFQGGIEIPLIISRPGTIPEGITYEPMVSLMDVFQTVLAAAGLPVPGERTMDGVDLVPYIKGEVSTEPHRWLYWKSDYNHALRMGSWKLMVDEKHQDVRLYNLTDDPGEHKDVSKNHPEILRQMLELQQRMKSQCRPPLWPRVMDFEMDVNGQSFWFAT